MDPLISVAELAGALEEVTELDVRYRLGGPPGLQEHAAGHIPGAAYVDLDSALASAPGNGGRHPLPSPEDFEAAMRAVGVRNDRPVVVYDDWEGRAAARAWWLLRYFGHLDVRVLDGGWGAWTTWRRDTTEVTAAADTSRRRTAESGPVEALPGDFVATPGAMPVVDAEHVLDAAVLIDARAPERWRGDVEPVDAVAGHIPGAVNVPTSDNLDADGCFRSGAELAERYAAAGVRAEVTVAAYCGSGVTATHDILAMEVAGLRAALYPGSWSGWITDPTRPVERGA